MKEESTKTPKTVVLTADEVWMIRGGIVELDNSATDMFGVLIEDGGSIQLAAGLTVVHRAVTDFPTSIARFQTSVA